MGSQAIQVTGQLIFNNPLVQGIVQQLQQLGLFVPMTGQLAACDSFTAPITTPGALPVSNLTGLGWYFIFNIDQAGGIVQLWSSVSGIPINLMNAGEFCMGRFDTTVTAPALLTTTGTPAQCVYLICEP